MHSADERKAANEAVFREVNEQIVALEEQFSVANEDLSIVCECARLDCAERLQVSIELYEQIRSDAAAFIVVTGHEDPTIEELVETRDDYSIVRKRIGEPRAVAVATDPRG